MAEILTRPRRPVAGQSNFIPVDVVATIEATMWLAMRLSQEPLRPLRILREWLKEWFHDVP